MDRTTRTRRTVVERMREQMALKEARARARELGIPLEAYLEQKEQEDRLKGDSRHLERMSEKLAARIADRLKGSLAAAPAAPGEEAARPEEPRIAFDDLQGIVDHLMQKGQP